MTLIEQKLVAKFTDKAYRDAFVAEQIFSRLPLKIRCLREDQGMTQRQLGAVASMAQTWVSKLEDPNYGKLTIATLLKVASALDVGLQIDFVPFSTVLRDAVYRTAESFSVPKFSDDTGLDQGDIGYLGTVNHATGALSGTVIEFPRYVSASSPVSAAEAPAPESAPLAAQPIAV